MAKKKNNVDEVTELRSKIIRPYSAEQLKKAGVPKEEISYLKNYIIIPIGLLVKEGWNYKKEDANMSSKLRENMKRIGQVENIHVRELDTGYYAIVNGNHRYDDLLIMGKKYVAAYDHGKIGYAEAIRRAVETNETRFPTDVVELAQRMAEMAKDVEMSELVLTMPFSEDEINELLDMSKFDFNAFNAPDPKADDSDPTRKTISFDIPRETYEKWLDVRKKIEAGKTISREDIFRFMLKLTGSLTKKQIENFHKTVKTDAEKEKD